MSDKVVQVTKTIEDNKTIYQIVYEHLLGELVIWNNLIVEENIIDQISKNQCYYLHYPISKDDDQKQRLTNFKQLLVNFNQQNNEIKPDLSSREILICCSSGLTSSMFALKLNDFCIQKKLLYHFNATSIFDQEALNQEYDLVLMAPQVQHYSKGLANKFNQRILDIDAKDYGQYNCNNIIALIQEIFL